VLLRLFAPFVPFATEEAWSWSHDSSVHLAGWPTVDEAGTEGSTELLELAGRALIGIRRSKTDAKASQKTPVATAVISGPAAQVTLLEQAAGDIRAVGRIADLRFAEGDELAVTEIVLAPAEQ
jgi:valyl-tRNA synthetase